MAQALIDVHDLTYAYPDGTRALDGLTLHIEVGESVGLVGPNGAGKSTFILHLNGFLRGQGLIRIHEKELIEHNLRDVRRMPEGGLKSVLYHVAVYLGRTDLPLERFAPQRSEVAELAYFDDAAIDRMLIEGRLAPNMAFAWLAYGRRLLSLAGRSW